MSTLADASMAEVLLRFEDPSVLIELGSIVPVARISAGQCGTSHRSDPGADLLRRFEQGGVT
jgi:hypothetical protein